MPFLDRQEKRGTIFVLPGAKKLWGHLEEEWTEFMQRKSFPQRVSPLKKCFKRASLTVPFHKVPMQFQKQYWILMTWKKSVWRNIFWDEDTTTEASASLTLRCHNRKWSIQPWPKYLGVFRDLIPLWYLWIFLFHSYLTATGKSMASSCRF